MLRAIASNQQGDAIGELQSSETERNPDVDAAGDERDDETNDRGAHDGLGSPDEEVAACFRRTTAGPTRGPRNPQARNSAAARWQYAVTLPSRGITVVANDLGQAQYIDDLEAVIEANS
ncbi:hypothetical protein JTF08_16385 [Micrococcaceae bacterium RIT802]|nr:hypothetical protein [Micrococcaceae bacterium RIT 802]